MGKKLFWSRDRLVKHEFDCLGLGLGLWFTGPRSACHSAKSLLLISIVSEHYNSLGSPGKVVVRVMNSFGVMVRVGIRVYVKQFCSAAKPFDHC